MPKRLENIGIFFEGRCLKGAFLAPDVCLGSGLKTALANPYTRQFQRILIKTVYTYSTKVLILKDAVLVN